MSRLYTKTQNDLSKTGNRGHQQSSTSIFWGSAGDSKSAVRTEVYWPKDAEHPTVVIVVGEAQNPIPEKNVTIQRFI